MEIEREPMTQEQIEKTIRTARDSITVIEEIIEELNQGRLPSYSRKSNIERNVDHLKIIVEIDDIKNSNQDISDLQAGIVLGEAKLSQTEWLNPSQYEILVN